MSNNLKINRMLYNPLLNNFVIFCHSYPTISLVFKILSLIETSYSNHRVIIIVNSSAIWSYLMKIFQDDSNITVDNIGSAGISLKRPYSVTKEIITRLKLVKKYKNISNTNVIFSSKNFIIRDYFVLQVLRRQSNNNFCYIDKFSETDNDREKVDKLTLIKSVGLFLNKTIYGSNLAYYCKGKILFMGIDDNYLNEFTHVELKEFDKIDINRHQKYKISVPCKIIYFDDALYKFSNRIFDQEKLKKLVFELLKRISETGISKEEVGIKFHPNGEKYLHILKYGKEINKFIPAEFLEADNCKLIFTAFSTVLNSFGKDVVKISIIDLLPWVDKETYKRYKKYLIEDLQVSFIPQSIDEFTEIISRIDTF